MNLRLGRGDTLSDGVFIARTTTFTTAWTRWRKGPVNENATALESATHSSRHVRTWLSIPEQWGRSGPHPDFVVLAAGPGKP